MNIIKKVLNPCTRCAFKFRYVSTQSKIQENKDSGSNEHKETANEANEPKVIWPKRIVTGLQPTGSLHVGNYFSVIRRCVKLQNEGNDVMIFIADLHAMTTKQEAGALREHALELAASLVAGGVDPARTVLFAQSAVPRHAELCWLLACLATHARLAHLPQYKEKAAAVKEVPIGLLLYPVLQAADVLVYRGTHVPAGADQLQHLQVAAQLVRTFRHRYGPAFPTPRALLPEDGSDRIRSLRDPAKKMSKSDSDPKSRILLTDSDEAIDLKLRKAVTDFTPEVTFEPERRPGVANLVTLHCLAQDKLPEELILLPNKMHIAASGLLGTGRAEPPLPAKQANTRKVVEESEGLTTAQYKRVVARALRDALGPVRARAAALRARPALLHDMLHHGAARARARADLTYADVAARVGLAPARPAHAAADFLAQRNKCL